MKNPIGLKYCGKNKQIGDILISVFNHYALKVSDNHKLVVTKSYTGSVSRLDCDECKESLYITG